MFLLGPSLKAQSPAFSQYYNNPIYYNPAYTGSELGIRARMLFRHQYGGLNNSYDNIAFSFDLSERNMPGAGGFGVVFLSDIDGIGLLQTNSLRLTYSTRIQISDRVVTQLGIGPSFSTRRINWDQLIFSDQIDAYGLLTNPSMFNPGDENSIAYPDLSFGVLFQFHGESRRFANIITTIGGAADHVFTPDVSFSGTNHPMPLKITITADVLFDNSLQYGYRFQQDRTGLKFNPGFKYEWHDIISTYSFGVNAYRSHIYLGIWGRMQQFNEINVSDIIMIAGIDIPINMESRIKLMYSYDYLIGDLMRITGTTHELSLVYELGTFNIFGDPPDTRGRRNRKQFIPLECPTF